MKNYDVLISTEYIMLRSMYTDDILFVEDSRVADGQDLVLLRHLGRTDSMELLVYKACPGW